MTITPSLTQRPAWQALEKHYQQIKDKHLRDLFKDDPERGKRFTAQALGLYLDYAKHRVTGETMKLLIDLAVACNLPERREAMFSGEKINVTEKRAVLHAALRAPRDAHILVDGHDVVPDVHADQLVAGETLGVPKVRRCGGQPPFPAPRRHRSATGRRLELPCPRRDL